MRILFWSFVIIALSGIAFMILNGPAGVTTDHDAVRTVYVTVLGAGIVVVFALRRLLIGGVQTLRYAAVWAGIFGLTIGLSFFDDEIGGFAERLRGEATPSVAMIGLSGEARLSRAWDGHYRADARVNGATVQLMVDTGASMVVLPYEAVAGMGIDPRALEFSMPVTTANGRSHVAPIWLDTVSVGEVEVQDVRAAVAQPGKLKQGLLGMSFLDRLAETTFAGDELVLRQIRHQPAVYGAPR